MSPRRRFRLAPIAFASLAVFALARPAFADDEADKAKEKDKAELPIQPERAATTQREVRIDGRAVRYTASAGNLLIADDKEKPVASVFYVAYTAGGAGDVSKRPVTFVFNGGPGSASLWLHMGSFGPVRVVTPEAESSAPAPYPRVANEYSLLDRTDLVFVDAIGTGYSRVVGKGDYKDFWGVDQDAAAFAKFVTRYVTLNHRWNSPKFLLGESYGTTRSAALVDVLQKQGMDFNGVILVSTILDFSPWLPGSDHGFVVNLPTYAAIAWYHKKLPQPNADLAAFLADVREFATGEYAHVLSRGQNATPAEIDAVAEKLHRYTGLSVDYLKRTNVRIDPTRFRKELLRDERRSVGRLDGRYRGTDADAAGEGPDYDPANVAISGPYSAAFVDYVTSELKYEPQTPFKTANGDTFGKWDWKHAVPGAALPIQSPYVVADLAEAMRHNPHLKVFAANGYYDLATPFFATEYDLGHLGLEPALRGNVQFGYYESGHMIYLHTDSLKQMKRDLDAFYDAAAHR